ncbi:MAG: phosphoglycerate mutase family protein [Rhodospirillales bacterium]
MSASSVVLYLLLNGETEYNAAYRFQGQNDSHLTKEGAQQALANPQKLSQLAPNIDQIRFTSSPLERTLATSKIICNAIGYDFTNPHTEAWIM